MVEGITTKWWGMGGLLGRCRGFFILSNTPALQHPRRSDSRARRGGFTLIEILVAVVILAMAFVVIARTFFATLNGWTKGNAFLEKMHHGDFVIEQLVSSLRSAAFYSTKPEKYGFWLDARGGSSPRDVVSWVTSSSAFMKPGTPFVNGLHRIEVTIEDNDEGDESFTVRAWSHFTDKDEVDPEPWHISSKVKGLECEVYDFESKSWGSTWEDTNAVPSLVRISLYLEPQEKYGEPMKISRLVELPIAPAVSNAVASTDAPGGGQPPAAGNGAPVNQQPVNTRSDGPAIGIGGGPGR